MKNDKKIQIKFLLDEPLNKIFRRLLKAKHMTIQKMMVSLIRDAIYDNIDLLAKEDK